MNLSAGSNNIDVGNEGKAADSGIIRIGAASTQTATFIAGIVDSKLTGNEVIITAAGQLGVKASSERYKTDIAPMGSVSAKLRQLRPVAFHLKASPEGDVQYGLIAEEVVKVYPELVIRDANGRIDGVRYDELAPMLLNEMQQGQKAAAVQAHKVAAQAAEIAGLKQGLLSQSHQLDETQQQVAELQGLEQALQEALAQLQSKEGRVAQR